jgi:hypothetical protein
LVFNNFEAYLFIQQQSSDHRIYQNYLYIHSALVGELFLSLNPCASQKEFPNLFAPKATKATLLIPCSF